MTERSPFGACPRGDLVRARWPLDLDVPGLRDVLTVHAPPPERATCIHRDPDYGTRSATLAALAPGRLVHYLVSAGPPCTHDLADVLAG